MMPEHSTTRFAKLRSLIARQRDATGAVPFLNVTDDDRARALETYVRQIESRGIPPADRERAKGLAEFVARTSSNMPAENRAYAARVVALIHSRLQHTAAPTTA
jgi:hypothetical protein